MKQWSTGSNDSCRNSSSIALEIAVVFGNDARATATMNENLYKINKTMATMFVETSVALAPGQQAVSLTGTAKSNNQLVAITTSNSKWHWCASNSVSCRSSSDSGDGTGTVSSHDSKHNSKSHQPSGRPAIAFDTKAMATALWHSGSKWWEQLSFLCSKKSMTDTS